MMGKICYLLVMCIGFLSCISHTGVPTQFSQEALNDTFLTIEEKSIAFKDILNTHKEEVLVIDVWASWCGDCIRGMAEVKKLQNEYPNVTFVFLSLDKSPDEWKQGIELFQVQGEHYYMTSGKNGSFGAFLDLDWIPRYMIVDKTGTIRLFEATDAKDKNIRQILNQYIN